MILYNMHNSSIVVAGHEWDGAGRKTFQFEHFMERDSNTLAMLQLHAQLLFLERFFTVAYYLFLDKTKNLSLIMNYSGLRLPHTNPRGIGIKSLFANVSH